MSQPGPVELPAAASADQFSRLAQPLLARPGLASATMMGLPCLRLNGQFFAAYDRRSGNLLVKLSEARTTQLLAEGQAEAFAPAGRRFRQWAAIPSAQVRNWKPLIEEALAFAEGHPASRRVNDEASGAVKGGSADGP